MTGIFFGSTMGTTEAVAADIAKQLNIIAETHFDLPERSKV